MSVLDRWNNFKRILLVICAALMWVMSIVFSYIGFKSDVSTEWYFGIFALILSATITSLELNLTSQDFNFDDLDMALVMLWIGGVAAYAYGIWTNVIGVSQMMIGGDLLTVKWTSQVIPIIVGILLEVLPEPMFIAFLRTKKIKKNGQNQQQNKQQQNPPRPHIPVPAPKNGQNMNMIEELRRKYPVQTNRPEYHPIGMNKR